ncbi:fluoride efflux transporter FluC [Gordonia sp. (in: high G+C Gram-positive bacteria)]|uniref:fluoride efflux transporter FluC n=1 Tax=unclassified Gordonia (in: high G+C Gram-positive bacteria) TaxID=2657482 RepID=UPI0026298C40|nr:CrcB family protein [Gordonia sp. (in: high G+C Gram-positive bacteria)]
MSARASALAGQGPAIGLVFVGGMVGALARYGVELALPAASGAFPWATFTVNIVGAFILGLLLESLVLAGPDTGMRRRARLFCGTGFTGAFTTYSSFAVEIGMLTHGGSAGVAAAYAAASLAAGLAVMAFGLWTANVARAALGGAR